MRNIFVEQTGHTPDVAGFPFFIVMGVGSFISRFVRHFRQYASTMSNLLGRLSPPPLPRGPGEFRRVRGKSRSEAGHYHSYRTSKFAVKRADETQSQ